MKIEKVIGGKYNLIFNSEIFKKIYQKKDYNTLEIIQKDKQLTYKLNGEQIFSDKGTKEIGFVNGFLISGETEIEVDDFEMEYFIYNMNSLETNAEKIDKVNLGSNVNSKYSEIVPVISADGKTIYFTRKYDPENYGKDKDPEDILFSNRNKDGSWGKSQRFSMPINNDGPNSLISISTDNNILFLSNQYNEDGSHLKSAGMSASYKTQSGWGVPKDIFIEDFYNLNAEKQLNYFLSPDKKYLLTSLQRYDSYGENDLYVSFLVNDSYTKPLNLGPVINTFHFEMSPFLAADNKTLYFSTSGHPGYGEEDVFMSKRLDDTWINWSEPLNLGFGINSSETDAYFTIPASGEYAYMTVFDDEYLSEIVEIKLNEVYKPEPLVLIFGKVFNSKNNEAIGTEIVYNNLSSEKFEGTAISDPITGNYKIILPYGQIFSFLAEKEGFYSVSENIDLTNISEYKEIERNLYLTPIEIGESFRLNNIFFDYDKSDLRPESFPELNRLIKLLNQYPNIKIEISGHTDSQGSEQYNLKLSDNRAKSVVQHLISHNISSTRLSFKGYGESIPLKSNETEEGRQFNRRVEVKIVGK